MIDGEEVPMVRAVRGTIAFATGSYLAGLMETQLDFWGTGSSEQFELQLQKMRLNQLKRRLANAAVKCYLKATAD
jgi:hypothetical protein